MMDTIGFLGCGNMGGAIARAVCKAVDPKKVFLANRTAAKAQALAKELGCKTATNAEVAGDCDLIFLAVKPQMMEALLTDSEVRIQIADNLPDKVQAQYIPNKRTIYVRNGMSENATFHSISRELACASLDHHDGSYSRAGVSAQAYCAAYVTAQKYGVDVSGFSFDKVCQMQAFGQKDPKELRSFIQDVKSAAYSIGKQVDRNLGKSEQEFMTDEFAIPEEKTEKPAKSKKSPER